MIDPLNQIIFVKGKRVDFDALPDNIHEKLLNSWNIKNKKKYERKETSGNAKQASSGNTESGSKTTKQTSRNRGKGKLSKSND